MIEANHHFTHLVLPHTVFYNYCHIRLAVSSSVLLSSLCDLQQLCLWMQPKFTCILRGLALAFWASMRIGCVRTQVISSLKRVNSVPRAAPVTRPLVSPIIYALSVKSHICSASFSCRETGTSLAYDCRGTQTARTKTTKYTLRCLLLLLWLFRTLVPSVPSPRVTFPLQYRDFHLHFGNWESLAIRLKTFAELKEF